MKHRWPKGPTYWNSADISYVSIPFTWNLITVREQLRQGSFWQNTKTVVGGPAVKLMPDFNWPSGVVADTGDLGGVLYHVNPMAMRTSTGCPNKCDYCAVPKIEPNFLELDITVPKPIICDNNFLGCSREHRQNIYQLLTRLPRDITATCPIDFNQGLDARLLGDWDAIWLRKLRAKCRLAYDYPGNRDSVKAAFDTLRRWGIPKSSVSFYVLVAWKDTPREAWDRCREVESWGGNCCPMWFHELDAMKWNEVTDKQNALGWTDGDRTDIMGYFWQRRGEEKFLK